MRFSTAADVAKLPIREKRYDALDSVFAGLRVRVTPNGAKSFSYLFRVKGERAKRRITLGPVGKLDLASARKLAREAQVEAVRGVDPAEEHRERRRQELATKKERKVAELFPEYLDDAEGRLAPATLKEYRRQWKTYLKTPIGGLLASAVATKDVAAVQRTLKSHPVLANRVVALVHAFMTWCEVQGIRPRGSNPATDVKAFKETSRERFLTSEELERLIKAIDAEAVTGNPHTIGALRFLTLTGWRRQEVFSLKWDAVDLERGIATLMRTKTGKSQRILSKAAVKVLKSLPRTVGHPYVFESPAHKPNPKWPKRSVTAGGRKSRSKSNKPPTRREPGLHPIASVDYLWDRVREKAELKAFRLHDLRHSAASFMLEAGVSLPEIGAVLGHRNASTTARYAHLTGSAVRNAIDALGDRITSASGSTSTVPAENSASVTPIESARALRITRVARA